MTTVVLTSPPIPGGGTVDGSGRDTVEVIPRPIGSIIDPPTILSTVTSHKHIQKCYSKACTGLITDS